MTDASKAIETARQEDRPLFIAFLGSDWSTASQSANKEILNTRAFKDFADANLVLLKIDFSRKGLTPEETQGYASMAKQLQVDHFPLFLLADPAHGTGAFSRINTYGGGGVSEFVDQIMGIMAEYRQVLAAQLAKQAQGQPAAAAPPPALPQASGLSGFPSPEQMLHQPPTAGPVGPAPTGPSQNPPAAVPSGLPSVQDLLNSKLSPSPAPTSSTAPAGNTDVPAFQLK